MIHIALSQDNKIIGSIKLHSELGAWDLTLTESEGIDAYELALDVEAFFIAAKAKHIRFMEWTSAHERMAKHFHDDGYGFMITVDQKDERRILSRDLEWKN